MWINGMYEKKPLLVKGRGVDEGVDNFPPTHFPVFIRFFSVPETVLSSFLIGF